MFVWLVGIGCFDSVEHQKEVIAVDQNARIDKLEQKIQLLEAKLSQNLEACSVFELDEDGDIISRANTPTFSSGDVFSMTFAPDDFPCNAQYPTNSQSAGRMSALSTE